MAQDDAGSQSRRGEARDGAGGEVRGVYIRDGEEDEAVKINVARGGREIKERA